MKKLVNFLMDKKDHTRFKAKTASENTDITEVLVKFIKGYIGKQEENKPEKESKEKIKEEKPKKELSEEPKRLDIDKDKYDNKGHYKTMFKNPKK